MVPLLRLPKYRPALGSVQVIPPRGLTALRGLHLDSACAPAVTWQLSEAGPKARSLQSMCPRFQGNRGTTRRSALAAERLALVRSMSALRRQAGRGS